MGAESEPLGHLTRFITSDTLAGGALTFTLEHEFSQGSCFTPCHTLPAFQETFVAQVTSALLENNLLVSAQSIKKIIR